MFQHTLKPLQAEKFINRSAASRPISPSFLMSLCIGISILGAYLRKRKVSSYTSQIGMCTATQCVMAHLALKNAGEIMKNAENITEAVKSRVSAISLYFFSFKLMVDVSAKHDTQYDLMFSIVLAAALIQSK